MNSVIVAVLEGTAAVMAAPVIIVGVRVAALMKSQLVTRRSRRGESYENFRKAFEGQEVPEPILQQTYRLLSEELALASGMPVHADDSLADLYGVGQFGGTHPDELAQWVLESADYAARPVCLQTRIETVRDFVCAMAALMAPVRAVEPRIRVGHFGRTAAERMAA